jgi:uncharacterized protein (DUF58 family)
MNSFKEGILGAFLTKRLIYAGFILIFIGGLSYFLPWVYYVALILLILLLVTLFVEAMMLYFSGGRVIGKRTFPPIVSIAASNKVQVDLFNGYDFPVNLFLFDELPAQLQARDFGIMVKSKAKGKRALSYSIKPMTRGDYHFGHLYVFVSVSFPGFLQRRFRLEEPRTIKVYPSVKEMRDLQLQVLSHISVMQGVKKMRRLGHSYEFEQIRQYVQGDDYRSINWKATGRRGGALMINQYEDEKAQPIYFVIDRSRNMKMPFNGLSLLDYSINSALALSNVAIQKSDRAGLVTFGKTCDTFIKADNGGHQMNAILEALYNQKQTDTEADYQLLYSKMKYHVKQRSLLFLYTNCYTKHSLERLKPILRLLNKLHLLVVILFENTEIEELVSEKSKSLEEIYDQTIAENFLYEQQLIALELNTLGIQCIVSKPEELTINSLNKYLEIKAKGAI